MRNPWQSMTYDDGLAMDKRKDNRPSVLVKRAILWRIIKRYLPEDDSAVLDLGGGTGIWAIRIAKEGHPVHLTDISPGLLTRAKERIESEGLGSLIAVREVDVCDLSMFADSSFKLVLALGDPLSYCEDAGGALKEIRRVTDSEGGVLIGDVENRYQSAGNDRRASTWKEAKEILLEGRAHWPEMKGDTRIREFSPSEISELLRRVGWNVAEMYPSDLVFNLVESGVFDEVFSSESGAGEIVAMEEELREDASLLGCGFEIQFVARKA